jgi:periplasmic protein TonB
MQNTLSKRSFPSRNTTIVALVMLLHIGGLWALHSGLLRRVAELIVPAEIMLVMSQAEETPVPTPPSPVKPDTTPLPRTLAPVIQPLTEPVQPVPLAVAALATEPEPSALSPAPVAQASPPPAAAPSGIAQAALRTPVIELPNSDAQYLNNAHPSYPPISKRLGEQGKVIVRTLIGVDGTAQDAHIKLSSGFDRLDQAAIQTALRWRYVPGKRAGVPEAMWFDVPFHWVLQ